MNRKQVLVGVAGVALVGMGYVIRAFASGIPSTGALTYAGVLESASGAVTGNHSIQVFFYNAASSGTVLCQMSAPATVSVVDGHFSVLLPDSCTSAVAGNPNVWVDVLVDGSDTGTTKIGAVPYAVEANHAPNADNATNATNAAYAADAGYASMAGTASTANTAGGSLATTISNLQSSITTLQGDTHTASGFKATVTNATIITSGSTVPVVFNNVEFDLASEYNATTGTFTAKNAGIYLAVCGFWWGGADTAGTYSAAIYHNGTNPGSYQTEEVDSDDRSIAATASAKCEVTAVVQLSAGDTLNCLAYQNSGANAGFGGTGGARPERDQFSAVRLY